MQTKFRGIFLTSAKPALTAQWYRDVAALNLEQIGNPDQYAYWKIDENGMQLAIHDATKFSEYTNPVCPDSNTTHLYFKIQNQAEFLKHLQQFEIQPYLQDEVVVTVVDPDGRKVMFGTA